MTFRSEKQQLQHSYLKCKALSVLHVPLTVFYGLDCLICATTTRHVTRFGWRQALAGTGIVVADMDFPSNDVEDARKRGLQPAGSLRPPHSLRILSILGDI